MQTPKTRTGSLEVPPRGTRTARQLKTPGSDSESVLSANPANRTPKDRSPKVVDRKSPRSPASEKKRPGRVSELESQLAQLQEELRKAKDQLNSSESWKRRAHQEAEEAKKQLAAMSAQLEESQQQLLELSASEESRVQELRKISQDRDRAWQSELEAVQKHHLMDSSALVSAMNEIKNLKIHLEMAAESESDHARRAESAEAEVESLRVELTETLTLVEELKAEIRDCKESEARVSEVAENMRKQLEIAKSTEEILRSEGVKAMEAYKSLASELEGSKTRANSLEGLVSKLQADISNNSTKISDDHVNAEYELKNAKIEMDQLKSALEAAERRYQEDYIQSTLQIRSAYELMESTKSDACKREAELEAKLNMSKSEIEDLKIKLHSILEENEKEKDQSTDEKQQSTERDNELEMELKNKESENEQSTDEKQQSTERDSELEMELKKYEADLAELKASLLDKETELQIITEENETLKLEIAKREMERSNAYAEALALAEAARASEAEALTKLGYLTEETDKSSRKAARVLEELEAAQEANSEMEAELRRLKVQSDQWRKAAEAAAAILSTGNNSGKYVERTSSLDSGYHTIGGKLSSPYSDDMDDISPKKKNGNMLKKIGVLLKKGQK